MKRIPSKNPRMVKTAELLRAGESIRSAMTKAGYSINSSSSGIASIPKGVMHLLGKKESRNLLELGKIDAGQQEELVRGRLVWNTIQGKDAGAMSAKLLGSDRRINMFVPDMQTGVIVVTQPKDTTVSQLDNEE
jgi:hypothetical protein